MHSPDVEDLKGYVPNDSNNFGLLLQLFVGPVNEKGEESFDIMICTPTWLIEHFPSSGILMGRHYLFVKEYNYDHLKSWLNHYVESCEDSSWEFCAKKLSHLAKWEFEDN